MKLTRLVVFGTALLLCTLGIVRVVRDAARPVLQLSPQEFLGEASRGSVEWVVLRRNGLDGGLIDGRRFKMEVEICDGFGCGTPIATLRDVVKAVHHSRGSLVLDRSRDLAPVPWGPLLGLAL